MIFDLLPQIFWWALQILIVLALVSAAGAALVIPTRRARARRLPPPRWRAAVLPAQQYQSDYYGAGYKQVRGEVAVRVQRPGGTFMTVGTVRTGDDNFEDLLNGLVAKAEDRAAALNAAEESLR